MQTQEPVFKILQSILSRHQLIYTFPESCGLDLHILLLIQTVEAIEADILLYISTRLPLG